MVTGSADRPVCICRPVWTIRFYAMTYSIGNVLGRGQDVFDVIEIWRDDELFGLLVPLALVDENNPWYLTEVAVHRALFDMSSERTFHVAPHFSEAEAVEVPLIEQRRFEAQRAYRQALDLNEYRFFKIEPVTTVHD